VSDEADPPKKKGKGMLFGIVGALLLGGGGAFATYSGMIDLPFGPGAKTEHVEAKPVAAISGAAAVTAAFVLRWRLRRHL